MKKRSENRLKAAALGTDDLKFAALIKDKLQNIKAASLKSTGVKVVALEYVKLNLWKLRLRRSPTKAAALVLEKSFLQLKLSNRLT